MDIRPILLSLKQNKMMALLMILQVAITMTVLTLSVSRGVKTLEEWNMPSGIPHESIIKIAASFFDGREDTFSAMQRDVKRIAEMDGVIASTRVSAAPFEAEDVISVYGSSDEQAEGIRTVVFESDTDILATLNLSLLEGRALAPSDLVIAHVDDGLSAPNVMLSASMAKALFSEETAVGKTIWLSKGQDPVQVVGVYSDFMVGEWLNGMGMSYQSIIRPQLLWSVNREPTYLVRVQPDVAEAKIEQLVSLFYQEQGRYVHASELLKRVQKRMYDGRGSRVLTELVIAVALFLVACAGVAGLTSYQVNLRSKQIGTRRALGARKSDVIRYFLTENVIVTTIGLIIGVLASVFMLFGMSADDETNYLNVGVMTAIALGVVLVNALATWAPARKAASISPAIVTRGN